MSQDSRVRLTMKATSKFTGIAGGILVLASLFVATYYPTEKPALWILGAVGGACLVFFFVAERHVLVRAPGTRSARYGANAVAIVLAFFGILVVLNILAVRHNGKWDVTADELFTRSDQTLKILGGLTKEVEVIGFFADGGEERQRMKELLDDYADRTPYLKVSFVDPDKDPALARQQNIREYGTTVFQSGDQTYRITQTTEEAVTNALVRVTRKDKKNVCFLKGHGERSPDDSQRGGYSTAKKALEDQGYGVREVLLLSEGEVPKDCAVLVSAGPTKPVLEQELALLRGFVDEGGKLALLLDPQTEVRLEPLLQEWGVVLHDDMIVDTMSRLFGGSYTTPILTEYPSHEITKNFRVATFLPLARSLDKADPLPEGVSFTPVARTSPQSWGETDLGNAKASFDPTRDYKGPLVVAGLFEKGAAAGSKGGGQMLVVGDSDFADNTYFNFSGNGDLFQNMVSFLAKEEDLISIRPKAAKPTPLILTRPQAATLFYASVVVAPLALVLAGLGIWWRRRNL